MSKLISSVNSFMLQESLGGLPKPNLANHDDIKSGFWMKLCDGRHLYSPTNIGCTPDMEFVQKFTPPYFRAKNFTPSISPNFNSFSKKTSQELRMLSTSVY